MPPNRDRGEILIYENCEGLVKDLFIDDILEKTSLIHTDYRNDGSTKAAIDSFDKAYQNEQTLE